MSARFPLLALLLSATLGCADKGSVATDTDAPDTTEIDADSDGYDATEDCNDTDAAVHPGATEACDGTDNNCDGSVDEGVTGTFYADDDGDSFGDPDATVESCDVPDGHVAIGTDCDDTTAESYPGAAERCDGLDNDCDGDIDEDVLGIWYADADADGYGDLDSEYATCDPPPGYVGNAEDCDDTEVAAFPGGTEVCDGVDNDCDGTTDEDDAIDAETFYADSDGDGFADPGSTAIACEAPSGYLAVGISDDTDCDDSDSAINPDAEEVCDSVDNNCDGNVDEDATDAVTYYGDSDGDGYGGTTFTTTACEAPTAYVTDSSDCDDLNADAYPGAEEVCDGVDNDCDGDTDEDTASAETFYADDDGDGFGDPDDTTESCDLLSGYTVDDTDCDDTDAGINPDAEEVCDGSDTDCDGDTDEGVLGTGWQCLAEHCAEVLADNADNPDGDYWLDFDGDGYGNQYTCDMTTDGGGWTQVVTWDRETNGDDWTDLESELDTVYDNMTTKSETSTYLYWADLDATSDVLAYERPVSFSNDGEILLDVHYYGYSMEGSAAFFYVETTAGDEDILCKENDKGTYSTTEYTYWSYTCPDSADTTWTWNDVYQSDFGDEIEMFHFRTFHYDTTGD
ncbi:MAG: hypothetical protein ACI8RZ_006382, partial [Myxococcota bacterium]